MDKRRVNVAHTNGFLRYEERTDSVLNGSHTVLDTRSEREAVGSVQRSGRTLASDDALDRSEPSGNRELVHRSTLLQSMSEVPV
jgi:hypothetical protein